MLLEHYNTEEKVLELLEIGDIRTLGPSIEESEFFQGEGTGAIFYVEYSDVMEYNVQEYNYLFIGGRWQHDTKEKV